MNRFLLGLALWLGLLAPSFGVTLSTKVGDAAYTILNTDTVINTTTAFTAPRTWTLPYAGGTCIGQTCAASTLQIIDVAGAIGQIFNLTITPQSGDTINGNSGSLIISGAGTRVILYPTSGSNWQSFIEGDYVTSGACPASSSTATVTITIATPGIITDTAHGLTGICPVTFTTTGALPTGLTASTVYYVVPSSITTNTYSVASSMANAAAGTMIATSGTQSGTQTRTSGVPISTATAANIAGVNLSQGEWECRGIISRTLGASTSVTILSGSIGSTSATIGTQGTNAATFLQTAANVMGALGEDTKIGPERTSLTSTTVLYLVAKDTFTVSTNNAFGALTCRRMH